jgi:drug/metabolite transporter (DMT)-like permease
MQKLSRAAVLALTILWATNFPIIKKIYKSGLTPPDYAALRFTLAACALIPLARWDDLKLLRGSAVCGLWVAGGYMTQAIALATASANKGALICSSQVILVALMNACQRRQCFVHVWVASVLAVVGVMLLELAGPVEPQLTDLWCLGMPVCFGMGYIQLEGLMEEYPQDARTVSALKVATIAGVGLIWSTLSALAAPDAPHLFAALVSPDLPWLSLLYTGLVTTAGAILVESIAFKYVPATDVAIILTTEPLWAALCAAFLLGEELSRADILGGALVISACLLNEMQGHERPAPGKGAQLGANMRQGRLSERRDTRESMGEREAHPLLSRNAS